MSTSLITLTTRTDEQLSVHILASLPSRTHAILAASEGFGQPINQALSLDVKQHLDTCHFGFQFLDANGRFAGFTLFKHYGDLLCGGGMMIRPRFQKSGLIHEGITLALNRTGARFLAYRTQSPRMWSVGQKVTRVFSPTPEMAFAHPELKDARLRAAELLGITTNITRAVFDRPLYAEKPTHLNPIIQRWWDSFCDFEAGDMVLCVGAL